MALAACGAPAGGAAREAKLLRQKGTSASTNAGATRPRTRPVLLGNGFDLAGSARVGNGQKKFVLTSP